MIKTGDKKQAAILGIVAVFSVGMLGKTALGSFSGPGASQPLQVRDLGGRGTSPRTEHTEDAAPASGSATSPLPTASGAPPAKEPPAPIVRDAFSKPDAPLKTKPFGPAGALGSRPIETQTKTRPLNPGDSDFQVGNKDQSEGGPLPNAKTDANPQPDGGVPSGTGEIGQKNSEKKKVTKKLGPVIRYSGFVEAGSPMGIITFAGSNETIQIGQTLPGGFKIEAITSDHIVIRYGKSTKTILIGKETQF